MKTESYLAELYVELTTRKLALPFNEDSDCIYEIYNSWFKFFSSCREQMKKIACQHPIICSYDNIDSIKVGCEAYFYYKKCMDIMRPHIEKYSYDFRTWWEITKRAKTDQKNASEYEIILSEIKDINHKYQQIATEIAQSLSRHMPTLEIKNKEDNNVN